MIGLATGSEGEFYDTGTAAGITAIFEDYSNLTLVGAMDVEMHDNSATIVTLDIAPHTEVTNRRWRITGRPFGRTRMIGTPSIIMNWSNVV